MAQHDVAHKEIAQHCRRDLARERPAAFPTHILRAHLNVLGMAKGISDFRDGCERGHDHYLHSEHVADLEQQVFDELGCFGLQHVHLPVGGDNLLSHLGTIRRIT